MGCFCCSSTPFIRKKRLFHKTNGFGARIKDFGYGIYYHNVSVEVLDTIKNPFITNMFKNFHFLQKLKRNDITIVINGPTEISKENIPYLKYWNIICIRKTRRESNSSITTHLFH
jgi:hypothetical protein